MQEFQSTIVFPIFHTMDQFCGSSLDTLNQFNIFIKMWILHLDAVLQMLSDVTFVKS